MAEKSTADERILGLFENVSSFGTAPRQWLAQEPGETPRLVVIRRVPVGAKGRVTEALALNHPNIMPPVKWLADEERPGEGVLYVVRGVVRGKNLRQVLEVHGGAQDSAILRRLILPVVDALEAAHAQGVEHGGVSQENILVDDAGNSMLTDFAVTDPANERHRVIYNGVADAVGDVRALARILVVNLPQRGAFGDPIRRERIETILLRCTTLTVLREVLTTLELLAGGNGGKGVGLLDDEPTQPLTPIGAGFHPKPAVVPQNSASPVTKGGVPRLICQLRDANVRVAPGGGSSTAMLLKNDGTAPLVIRMIATEGRHTWLNPPRIPLPMILAPGEYRTLLFAISAARLAPGDYRSQVYLSANAAEGATENLLDGYFKHVCEMRVTVE